MMPTKWMTDKNGIKRRKLAGNTHETEYPGGMRIITYHSTSVVVYRPAGARPTELPFATVILDSGGWRPRPAQRNCRAGCTTKERINWIIEPLGLVVTQEKKLWYIWVRLTGERIPFADGLCLRVPEQPGPARAVLTDLYLTLGPRPPKKGDSSEALFYHPEKHSVATQVEHLLTTHPEREEAIRALAFECGYPLWRDPLRPSLPGRPA